MDQPPNSNMPPLNSQERLMQAALLEAQKAEKKGEVPIGAVLVKDGKIIARGHNLTKTKKDPTAHAEMVVLKKASLKLKNERLLGTELFVTLEPCSMCAGALVQARVRSLVYGAKDPKAGACGSVLEVIPNKNLNHRPQVSQGILGTESSDLLQQFFRRKRRNKVPLRG